MHLHDTVAALRGTELFASLGASALREVAAAVEVVELAAGSVLFHEGEPGDALYVVARGRLRVLRDEGGQDRELTEVGPGDLVGELAVISESPRHASVRAVRDSRLLKLSRASFHALVASRPGALLDLVRLLVDRIATPSAAPVSVHTVAVVAATGTDPRLARALARSVARSLRAVGSAEVVCHEVVGHDDVTALTTQGDTGVAAALAEHLHRLEGRADVVLLLATSPESRWSESCLRQADRVLEVADVRAAPVPSPSDAAPGLVRRDLVIVHPAGSTELSGTGRWLAGRAIHAHHQVRKGSQQDCDRLARSLTGRSVGIVLSGGGPRGFAHLGAIRAIQEVGIPIDAIGGSSIGALMGAGVAFGWDHASTIERAQEALRAPGALLRPTLPIVALSSGRRVERLLRSPGYLGDRVMEDALIPWFCVSTSLRRARIVVHDRGPAWRAVRASFALPGVLPPVYNDGDLLVDGGVLDNLPVDVMRRRLDGSVVGVDLEPPHDERAHRPFDPSMSGWRVLGQRLNPFGRSAAPSALQVLLRSKQVGVRELQRSVLDRHPVELYLQPRLDSLGALDFRAGGALVEVAYRQTLDALASADLSGLLPATRAAG